MTEDNRMVEAILHYQRNIERNVHDEKKILHCINKLLKLPITVSHLKETGIGRTVNSLRKIPGDVGEYAKKAVSMWKDLVSAAEENEEEPESPPPEQSSHSKKHKSSKKHDKHSESKSSHKESKPEKKSDFAKEHRNRDDEHSSSSKRKRSDSDEEDISEFNGSQYSNSHDDVKSESNHKSSSKHKKHKHKSKDRDESESSKKSSSSHKESSKDKKCSEEKVKTKHKEEKKKEDGKEKSHKSESKSSKIKIKETNSDEEGGICSSSGTSFAEALGGGLFMQEKVTVTKKSNTSSSTPTPKKSSTSSTSKSSSSSSSSSKHSSKSKSSSKIDIIEMPPPLALPPIKLDLDKSDSTNISQLLPAISTNYQPVGHYLMDSLPPPLHKQKSLTEEEALSLSIMSRNQRTKVYSGVKIAYGKVSSLFDICVRVLQENIDALEATGGIPYSILKPVLERANPDQLFTLENYNPYLIEDTDELWQFHCSREFRTKKREELESWREFYLRCVDERERKLKALTANIKLSQDKSLPVRQTKLAYVDSAIKPPRDVLRKQAKYGTNDTTKKPIVTPSSRLSTLAAAGAAGQVSVPNPGARAAAASHAAAPKIKKAPLMQKTLALMKNSNRFKR